MNIVTDEIFKRDSNGKLRSWQAEIDTEAGAWRTIAGIVGGKKVVNKWTTCKPKSRPTAGEQAEFEAFAEMRKKLARDYAETVEGIDLIDIVFPMLAENYGDYLDLVEAHEDDLWAQPKLDGIRCIARATGLWSREGQPILSCPHIWDELKPFFEADPDLVLDGELYNHDLHDDFNMISSMIRKKKITPEVLELTKSLAQYHVYDIASMSDAPFSERSERLHEMFFETESNESSYIRVVLTVHATGRDHLDKLYDLWMSENFEGQIIRLNYPYQRDKRTKYLLKRKEFDTTEFEVVDILEGSGNWAGIAKKAVFYLPDGRTFEATPRGDMDENRKRLKERSRYIGGTATVRHKSYTPDGIPRHGTIIDWQPMGRKD